MDNIKSVGNKCFGCMSCAHICKKDAITIRTDEYGFYKPYVKDDMCVDCGLCSRYCPALHFEQWQTIKKTLYGCSRDENVRRKSSSGGAFYEIAYGFLKSGGIVYGCTAYDPFNIRHIRIKNTNDLKLLQGSKYVQSYTVSAYNDILKDLKKGEKVLFSGTPCQVAAVKNIFEKYKSQLYTIDLVCFGFLSNGAYSSYLKSLEIRNNSTVNGIIFRDKEHENNMNISFANGEHTLYRYNAFTNNRITGVYEFFLNRGGMKEICTDCIFRQDKRAGDITLSDYPYSMCGKYDPKHKGLSVIYINTERSFGLLEKANLVLNESNIDIISYFVVPTSKKVIGKRAKIFRGFMKKHFNDAGISSFCEEYDTAAKRASAISDTPRILFLLKRISNRIIRIIK